jgi:hypothetical protein
MVTHTHGRTSTFGLEQQIDLSVRMTARMMSVGILGRARRVAFQVGLFSGFLVSGTDGLSMMAVVR